MRDKNFNSLVDEEANKLKEQVRNLKNQEKSITANLKTLEEKRNKLSKDILELSNDFDNNKKTYKEKIDSMLDKAQEKVKLANIKEAQTITKLSGLDKREKEANDAIKSNQGLQEGLEKKNAILKENIIILKNLKSLINEELEKIK